MERAGSGVPLHKGYHQSSRAKQTSQQNHDHNPSPTLDGQAGAVGEGVCVAKGEKCGEAYFGCQKKVGSK